MPTEHPRPPRRAGLRPDELSPGQSNEDTNEDHNAIGTPGGGLASGGLAGTNAGDGSSDDDDIHLDDAMSAGIYDHSGDKVDLEESGSSPRPGLASDSPAGKRAGRQANDAGKNR